MATKRIRELRNLSKAELTTKIRESEDQLFQTRMKKVTGQLEDTAALWRLRKDLARMKMLVSQEGNAKTGVART
ncbi:MAG: 50S ribosomal protein L29 [Bdellovibrio sp.]|nr:50S ribosomal protein L29 [Bdellovibrio sp.]